MLTPQQEAHFKTFGFLHFKRLFSSDEMDAITREFDDVLEQDRGGAFYNEEGQGTTGAVEQRPVLSGVVEDDRIYEAIEQLLGPDFIWAGSECNTSGKGYSTHRWHADRPGEANASYPRIKIIMYLDETSEDRGCLRVIPGSHRPPLHTDLEPLQEQQESSSPNLFGVSGLEMPSIPVESQPGDAVLFTQSLFHAVFKGFERRRYIALKFAARPTTEQHFQMVLSHNGRIFDPDPVWVNSQSRRIRRMVDTLVGLKAGE